MEKLAFIHTIIPRERASLTNFHHIEEGKEEGNFIKRKVTNLNGWILAVPQQRMVTPEAFLLQGILRPHGAGQINNPTRADD